MIFITICIQTCILDWSESIHFTSFFSPGGLNWHQTTNPNLWSAEFKCLQLRSCCFLLFAAGPFDCEDSCHDDVLQPTDLDHDDIFRGNPLNIVQHRDRSKQSWPVPRPLSWLFYKLRFDIVVGNSLAFIILFFSCPVSSQHPAPLRPREPDVVCLF